MNIELQALIEQRDALNKQISNFKDGFTYEGQINAYGYNRKVSYSNIGTVLEDAIFYNGDNGWMSIRTNNPELADHENDGLNVTLL